MPNYIISGLLANSLKLKSYLCYNSKVLSSALAKY